MIRALLLFLAAASLAARASDPIPIEVKGASATVSQPHVTAELIPEETTVQPGETFDVILHLRADPGWHTYWIDPGDAGLATTIKWTLPPGFIAGPIQWPTPEKHEMGGLMTFGYASDVYLLTTITPPKGNLPRHFDIKAHAAWLVCQEECIPGKADLTLTFDTGPLNLRLPMENKELFERARERLPVPNTRWDVKAAYGHIGLGQALIIQLQNKAGEIPHPLGHLYFFPEQSNVLDAKEVNGNSTTPLSFLQLILPLQQNGEKPPLISGVLASDQPLIGNTNAVYIAPFSTNDDIPINSASVGNPTTQTAQAALNNQQIPLRHPELVEGSVPSSNGPDNSLTRLPQPTTSVPFTGLIAVLGAAFVGGLILNLMPCVLPVLSLKVFSLIRHAGENPKAAWLQGVAFTIGVVLSFWVLAGLLLALRAAGNQLGWGFQMQSPGFVLVLILLFFLLALNLFGVFELGASLTGLDAKTTSHVGGLASSFLNGALATLAATPCTAPFMGSSLGFAAQQPTPIALLIFTFLALGMATPYLLLTIFPGALRFIPKPGAWMEALKQFMGFLLMATVIFLLYVFGALVGEDQIPWLLMVLLIAGVAAWIYGRWSTPNHAIAVRFAAYVLTLGLLAYAIDWGVTLAQATPPNAGNATTTVAGESWQPWSPVAVDQALTQNRPVFVDFTAAWCLSCKVNKRLALDTDSVRQAFAKKNVALFRADWTHADPAISRTLQEYHRDGVPLYLLYSPGKKDTPQVLPAVLTPGIVRDALDKL